MHRLAPAALSLSLLLSLLALSGCTLQHSRQALHTGELPRPSPEATFVTEEDSGLGVLLGLFLLSEPDHYVVLMERMRERHSCGEIHSAQLDFYTDHWLLITFPIARLTAVCEPPAPAAEPAPEPAAEPDPAAEPAAEPAAAPAPAPAPEPAAEPVPAPTQP